MTLYFQNSNRERRVIAQPKDEKEVSEAINKFLEKNKYKSYYTRKWTTPEGETMYDVGSHSEFFVLINY